MGKFMDNLLKQFAEKRRQEKDTKSRRHSKALPTVETETFGLLREVYDRVCNLTDKDPFMQVVHHLASPMVMDLWGPHVAVGGESFEALAVDSGHELYGRFINSLWKETSERILADQPIIDPLGELYMQVRGQAGMFTPMDTVHTMNTMVIGAQEKDISTKRMVTKDGLTIPRTELMHKDHMITGMDPGAGDGRFGLDAMAFYPRISVWNLETDLERYRLAVLNGRIFLPYTNIRTYIGSRPGMIFMGRINNLCADSYVVDVSQRYNWNLGTNKWDPPDWRTDFITVTGDTLWDLERKLGENHAYEEIRQRNIEAFKLDDLRFQITVRPPMPLDGEVDEDTEEEIKAAQISDMPSAPGAAGGMESRVSLRDPGIAAELGSMMDTEQLVERLVHGQEEHARIEQSPILKRLAEWTVGNG